MERERDAVWLLLLPAGGTRDTRITSRKEKGCGKTSRPQKCLSTNKVAGAEAGVVPAGVGRDMTEGRSLWLYPVAGRKWDLVICVCCGKESKTGINDSVGSRAQQFRLYSAFLREPRRVSCGFVCFFS